MIMQSMKKICALTMVRNDDFFLRKWVEYYGKEFGMENIYIYLDGKDQPIPDWCPGVSVAPCDKLPGKVVELEKRRLRFLSERAAELFERYDIVIGTDADEFLIVDPSLGMGLAEFLSSVKSSNSSMSGLGVDVGQNTGCEGVIDPSRPFLTQRRYALLSSRYTKPSVMLRPVRWGSGFHRIKGHDFHITENLYLFHFGSFDLKRIKDRMADKQRVSSGRHLAKRTRTITKVSRKKACDWNRWTVIARRMQAVFRPLYAVNKPSMAGLDIVVRIPERFSDKV